MQSLEFDMFKMRTDKDSQNNGHQDLSNPCDTTTEFVWINIAELIRINKLVITKLRLKNIPLRFDPLYKAGVSSYFSEGSVVEGKWVIFGTLRRAR